MMVDKLVTGTEALSLNAQESYERYDRI